MLKRKRVVDIYIRTMFQELNRIVLDLMMLCSIWELVTVLWFGGWID